MNDLQRSRLEQAQAALEEATAARDAGMDVPFVLNGLYYAFYYPVVALVHAGQVPETMQSVTIGLFERHFVQSGAIPSKFLEAVRRMFELKPKCGDAGAAVTNEELDRLFVLARDFLSAARMVLEKT